MSEARKTDGLLPPGLVVDDVMLGPDEVVITAYACGRDAECPECGRLFQRVYSRYVKGLSDVPAHALGVMIGVDHNPV